MNEYMMHRMSTVYHTQMSQFLYHLMPYTTSNMHQFMHILFQMIFTLAIFVFQCEKFDFFYVYAFSTALYRVHFSKCNYSMRMRRTFYGIFYLNVCALFDSIAMKLFKKNLTRHSRAAACWSVRDSRNRHRERAWYILCQPASQKTKKNPFHIYILLLKINTFTCTHICQCKGREKERNIDSYWLREQKVIYHVAIQFSFFLIFFSLSRIPSFIERLCVHQFTQFSYVSIWFLSMHVKKYKHCSMVFLFAMFIEDQWRTLNPLFEAILFKWI